MLEFLCPTCGNRVQGDDSFAGQSMRCPGCNATLTVPGGGPLPDTAIAEGSYPTPPSPSDATASESLPRVPSLRKDAGRVYLGWFVALIVGVVGLTAACLVIAPVSRVRDDGARLQSVNNLKQIAWCMASFQDVNRRIPFNGTVRAVAEDPKTGSWAFQILPYIDQAPMFNRPPEQSLGVGVQAYMCPGRGRQGFCDTGPQTDYFINPFLNDPDGKANAPDMKRTLIGITDGASNTIFVGQGNIDPDLYASKVAIPQSTDIFKGGDPALARRLTTNQRDKKGDGGLTWGGPFPQGSLMGMGDGTVRMFPYSVTGGVIRNGKADGGFAAFLTPTGGEAAVLPD